MGSMEFGSVPTPPKTPRSSTSTQVARQSTARHPAVADRPGPAGRCRGPAPTAARATHEEEVDPPAVRRVEGGEEDTQHERRAAAGSPPLWAIAARVPWPWPVGPARTRDPARPAGPPSPRKKAPIDAEDQPAQPGVAPGPVGQGHQHAGGGVEERRRRAPRTARSAPGRRWRRGPPRTPRPPAPSRRSPGRPPATTGLGAPRAARCRCRAGSTRRTPPPAPGGWPRSWRRCRRGAGPRPGDPAAAGRMHCGGMPQHHPGWSCRRPSTTQSRPKPMRSMRRPSASGPRAAGRRPGDSPRGHRPPVLQRPQHVPRDGGDDGDQQQEELVQQGVVERRDHRRVVCPGTRPCPARLSPPGPAPDVTRGAAGPGPPPTGGPAALAPRACLPVRLPTPSRAGRG